ncbi:Mut7-C ubiquitin/RNAse domain-containing protein [Nocardia vinacea]|uniref:Mut7-C ubiquitin/RNAse domain-containing protein n=1 Tax=Nocardia vinacea TaxID=96468 RepID=A0ABZ1YLJ6_9NOCA|nr:Mut7-C ubiquitin/RNAse domain-containing protein [Nocardia vinacea]
MSTAQITIDFAPELRLFVAAAQRDGRSSVRIDTVSTLGHIVESLGVPLTEVGELLVDGRSMDPSYLPTDGESVSVRAVMRPQRFDEPLRFLLDIHLGTLARRLRLLGIDTAYENPDIGDAALATRSATEHRILLSRDRGLLRRREIFAGAYIYSHRPVEQLDDVLSRFAPPLAPWTRCTACNGPLRVTDKQTLRGQLPDETERTYDAFAQCADCGRTYWKGAHHAPLDAIVTHALHFGT